MKRHASAEDAPSVKQPRLEEPLNANESIDFWVLSNVDQKQTDIVSFRAWATTNEWTRGGQYIFSRKEDGEVVKVIDYPGTLFIEAVKLSMLNDDVTTVVLQCSLVDVVNGGAAPAAVDVVKGKAAQAAVDVVKGEAASAAVLPPSPASAARQAAAKAGIGFNVVEEWTVVPMELDKKIPYHVTITALSWEPEDNTWGLFNRDALLEALQSGGGPYRQSVEKLIGGLRKVHEAGWIHGQIDSLHILIVQTTKANVAQLKFILVGFEQATTVVANNGQRELDRVTKLLWTDIRSAPNVLAQPKELNTPLNMTCVHPKLQGTVMHLDRLLGSGEFGTAYVLCDAKHCDAVLKLTILNRKWTKKRAQQEFEFARGAAKVGLGPAVYKLAFCPVEDTTHREVACMSMAYLRNCESLYDVRDNERLAPPALRDIFVGVYRRLVAFHTAVHAVHNDLHGNNILIDVDAKRAWVIDYGLATYVGMKKLQLKFPNQPPIETQTWFQQTFPELGNTPTMDPLVRNRAFADAANSDLLWLAYSFGFISDNGQPIVENKVDDRQSTSARPLESNLGQELVREIQRGLEYRISGKGWQLEYRPHRLALSLDSSTPEAQNAKTFQLVLRLGQLLGLAESRLVLT
jgi:hypothetical protein